MRQFSIGPRQSGRTYNFIQSLPDGEDKLFIVVSTYGVGTALREQILKMRGPEFKHRIVMVPLDAISYKLSGIDPLSIFFEHTAYEYANSKQYKQIVQIENLQSSIWSNME